MTIKFKRKALLVHSDKTGTGDDEEFKELLSDYRKVSKALENIDGDLDDDNISFVKCGGGEEVGIDYGILDFPSLVFIQVCSFR